MSVINKVLRDLDQRQAVASGQTLNNPLNRDQVVRGTRALAHPTSKAIARLAGLAMGMVGLALVALAVWWWMSHRSVSPTDPSPSSPVSAALAPVALPALQASAAPATSLSVPLVGAAVPSTSAPGKSLAASDAAEPVNPVGSAVARPVPAAARLPALPGPPAVPASPLTSEVNAAAPVSSLVGPTATQILAQAKPTTDSVQQGSNQALAQAQAMWNEGSRASAIDLLRQALSRMESASPGGSATAAPAPMVALVRELGRMELAEGQVGNALKLLVRLEPQINQVADLWAMRGNAAQRLGQHADASSSYRRALVLKPDEPRWMLGLAVSLAAQGQTVEAAELAEKVRALGALRPDIANYLRQLGVVIHAD